MEDRPEIPGYYFDREKNKYFKIQPYHTTPANLTYSVQDVKRRKARDKREKALEVALKRQKGRLRRAAIFQEPLKGGILKREHGDLGLVDTGRVFAAGLVRQGCLADIIHFVSGSDLLFDIDHRPDLGHSLVDVRIVYDAQLVTLRVNADKHTRSNKNGSIEICHGGHQNDFMTRFGIDRLPNSGFSTSLSLNHASKCLAVTWMAGTWQAGIAISPMKGIPSDGEFDGPHILLGPGATRSQSVTMHSSTSAPPSSSLLFALGSSHGLLTIDKRNYDMNWLGPKPTQFQNYPKDIFALEFLSDTPSVLLSGGRPGLLHITDLRAPTFGYGNSDIISHPSSITHIKQLDAHRILVAGLDSHMCQYDLRYRKEEPFGPSSTRYSGSKNPRNSRSTRSILTYPEYYNPARIHLGFDVDLESGIIAAAQEQGLQSDISGSPAVGLFSLHGGHVLPSPDASKTKSWDFDEDVKNVRCVKFARDIEGKMKSLYVGQAPLSQICRYTWADREEADEC